MSLLLLCASAAYLFGCRAHPRAPLFDAAHHVFAGLAIALCVCALDGGCHLLEGLGVFAAFPSVRLAYDLLSWALTGFLVFARCLNASPAAPPLLDPSAPDDAVALRRRGRAPLQRRSAAPPSRSGAAPSPSPSLALPPPPSVRQSAAVESGPPELRRGQSPPLFSPGADPVEPRSSRRAGGTSPKGAFRGPQQNAPAAAAPLSPSGLAPSPPREARAFLRSAPTTGGPLPPGRGPPEGFSSARAAPPHGAQAQGAQVAPAAPSPPAEGREVPSSKAPSPSAAAQRAAALASPAPLIAPVSFPRSAAEASASGAGAGMPCRKGLVPYRLALNAPLRTVAEAVLRMWYVCEPLPKIEGIAWTAPEAAVAPPTRRGAAGGVPLTKWARRLTMDIKATAPAFVRPWLGSESLRFTDRYELRGGLASLAGELRAVIDGEARRAPAPDAPDAAAVDEETMLIAHASNENFLEWGKLDQIISYSSSPLHPDWTIMSAQMAVATPNTWTCQSLLALVPQDVAACLKKHVLFLERTIQFVQQERGAQQQQQQRR